MCTFWTLCSHDCEPNLFWKVVENEFCESWKTLEFGLCKSWKVLENSILLSVQTLWAATWLGARETKLDLKLGALLNTVQGSLLPTHHAHTQTHTHTHTHSWLRNGPTYMALVLWLNSPPCKWSGVEWRGRHC